MRVKNRRLAAALGVVVVTALVLSMIASAILPVTP